MQWSFKSPFGEPIFVNGTVQYIQKISKDNEIIQLNSSEHGVRSIVPGQELSVAKGTISIQFCGAFPMANSQHVSAQVPAIVTISGPAVIGPGPRNCAQVSCAQNSAIWWCNDVRLRFGLDEYLMSSTQRLIRLNSVAQFHNHPSSRNGATWRRSEYSHR